MEVVITNEDLETYKNNELSLVTDLWAVWYESCEMIGSIISELAEEYDGEIVVDKCDAEGNDGVAIDFGVCSIPAILFFKGGQLVDKFVGVAPKGALKEKFDALS